MYAYVLRRLAIAFITIAGASFITFSAVRMLPGSTVDVLLQSGGYADVKTRQDLERALGIDRPIPVQYASWVSGLVQGDLGKSLITKRDIAGGVGAALPVTLELGLLSVFFATIIGVPVGILSAFKQNTWLDYLVRSMSVFFLSVPGFFLGVVIITFGSLWFNWTPPLQYIPFSEDPWGNIKQFSLPAMLLGLASSAGLMRFARTSILEVIRQDYVRTARAKGLPGLTLISRHVMKNAMLPILTIIGLYLAFIVGGSVIFEQQFQLPGIGRYFFTAIAKRDYPGIQAVALFYATVVVLVNLGTDLVYAWLDPRIQYK